MRCWMPVMVTLVLVGCAGASAPVTVQASSAADACAWMQPSSAEPLVPNIPIMSRWPTEVAVGARQEVRFAPFDGAYGGTLSLKVPQDGTYTFYLSQVVPLEVRAMGSGSVVAPLGAAPTAGCAEVAAASRYRLSAGSYFLELGPTKTIERLGLAVRTGE